MNLDFRFNLNNGTDIELNFDREGAIASNNREHYGSVQAFEGLVNPTKALQISINCQVVCK